MDKKLICNISKYICILLLTYGSVSCVSRNEKFMSIDEEVRNQNFTKALKLIEESKTDLYNSKKDAVLYYLDTGYLALHGNDAKLSQKRLQEAERLMSEHQKAIVSEEAASYLVNDTIISYGGFDYEKLYANIGLSLSYLSNGETEKGFIEIRRAQNIINKIQADNYTLIEQYNSSNADIKVNPKNYPLIDSAFARWMSWWLYRNARDQTNIPVAERNYARAIGTQPGLYYFGPPSIQNWNYKRGGTSVKLVAMTETVPQLDVYTSFLEVRNQQLILSSELREDGELKGYDVSSLYTGVAAPGLGEGLTFPISFVKFDQLSLKKNTVARIEVRREAVDGELLGEMSLIEDVGQIAFETFKFRAPWLYAKQIARIAFKIIGSVALESAQEGLGGLALITTLALEAPDTRSSRYLPKRIWVGEVPVQQEYSIMLVYLDRLGNIVHNDLLEGQYDSDELNLRTSTFLK